MTTLRQQILNLHLAYSTLESYTIAWALFDGAASADKQPMQSGDEETPPNKFGVSRYAGRLECPASTIQGKI